jgi:molybdate transport system substrate-binding protein
MRRFDLTMAALAAVAVAGCASSSSLARPRGAGGPSTSAASGSPAAQPGTIAVFAAASLKEMFTQLGRQFQAAHAGDTAKFSFGASSALATQINSGTPHCSCEESLPSATSSPSRCPPAGEATSLPGR